MKFIAACFALVALAALGDVAHAHPGHIADGGHGHNHVLALIIVVGLGVFAAGVLAYRLVKGRLPFFDARRAGE
jgi:hypothetical protein